MKEDSLGILINDKNEGEQRLKVITSLIYIKFRKKSCSWRNIRIEYRLFKNCKKDFWKELI